METVTQIYRRSLSLLTGPYNRRSELTLETREGMP
jgi:hypothetical protein